MRQKEIQGISKRKEDMNTVYLTTEIVFIL
jgi:hypothetical protein